MSYIVENDKYKKLFNVLGRWVTLNDQGVYIGEYLKEKNIKNVAIQGFGALGKHLLNKLQKSQINVVYGIDQRKNNLNLEILMKDFTDIELWPDVELIIVTALADYYKIEKEICEKRKISVISLEELIIDMEKVKERSSINY